MLNDTTNCPNCKKYREDELKDRQVKMFKKRTDAYGKLSERQYLDIAEMEKSVRTEKVSSPISFQETWDLGLVGNHLEINYRGKCHICQFTVEFSILPIDVMAMQRNEKMSLVEGQTTIFIIDPKEAALEKGKHETKGAGQ